jgi:hypothetical protein
VYRWALRYRGDQPPNCTGFKQLESCALLHHRVTTSAGKVSALPPRFGGDRLGLLVWASGHPPPARCSTVDSFPYEPSMERSFHGYNRDVCSVR